MHMSTKNCALCDLTLFASTLELIMNLRTNIAFACLATCLVLITNSINLVQAKQERTCTVTSADFSKLTFHVFDQDLDSPLSWRCIAGRGEYKQAQELIRKYTEINKTRLEQHELRILNFHSGQLAAVDGRYENAIEKFYQALDDSDGPADLLSWNEYVSGTIYFLEGDIKKLEQEIEKIESRDIEMDVYNLRILKNFLKCSTETYKSIYSGASSCINDKPDSP